ncbi:MAG: sugar ABC transporter permease [Chloroflexi bacterium]|nr:sugar ABC transporter permease [Chloroflexota bacterium]
MAAIELLINPLERWLGARRMAYFFLLPNMLIFGIFVLFPMLLNFFYSGTAGTRLMPQDRTWVGLDNYETIFDCANFLDPNSCAEDMFWRAAQNTTVFVVFQVGGMVLMALLTAVILNREIVARGFFRSVFFYPVLLSPVVVGLIWKWILQRFGLLNGLISGVGGEPVQWLLERDWATFWVILISIWAQMGFYTLILLAGLQAIPGVLYEASEIDGAGAWQRFRFITLPLLMPTMFVVLVLALIRAVQVFDQVFVLTGGGPGTATKYMVQYIYETGFAAQIPRRGLASAASVLLGGVLMLFTLVQLWLGRKSEAT